MGCPEGALLGLWLYKKVAGPILVDHPPTCRKTFARDLQAPVLSSLMPTLMPTGATLGDIRRAHSS
jgi:hypothetical protein